MAGSVKSFRKGSGSVRFSRIRATLLKSEPKVRKFRTMESELRISESKLESLKIHASTQELIIEK